MSRRNAQPARPYHHGDLRRALLDVTGVLVAEVGPTALSLRELARRAGVSHAAPAHHFGDKTGLLTAFAIEGFELLTQRLTEATTLPESERLLGVGRAYVVFAHDYRSHFEVMYRRDLLDEESVELKDAMKRSTSPMRSLLRKAADDAAATSRRGRKSAGQTSDLDLEAVAVGLWAQMHGLATLLVNGNLPAGFDDPAKLTDRVVAALDAAERAVAAPR